MKKLLSFMLALFMCIVFLTGCSKTTDPQFRVGEIVTSSMGEGYTQLITVNYNLNGDSVEITSHKIEATKELDKTNPEDYAIGRLYYKYLYTATVVGKVDSKYAGKAIYIYTQYPIDVQTDIVDGYKNGALVNEDGEFELKYYVYCNELLTTFYPYWVQIES